MSLYFRSLRSSSAGNCVQIWTDNSQIIIDCGFKTQWECEEVLSEHAGRLDDLDAVLVTHVHGDHIGYPALTVLASHGVRIMAHHRVMKQIHSRHQCSDWDERPSLHAFSDESFQAGDFHVTPIELPHEPGVATYGFVICRGDGEKRRKIVVCTDFCDYGGVLDQFLDADFIFVESNHDLDLLRKHPNYASQFHLNNPQTAALLCDARRKSSRPPRALMLGHLSDRRNREKLALGTVEEMFDGQHAKIDFDLCAAPLYEPSETIQID
jgi:phosphoribosyl 1,2-cyclic phosphodiesterase